MRLSSKKPHPSLFFILSLSQDKGGNSNIYDTKQLVPRFTRFYFYYSVFFKASHCILFKPQTKKSMRAVRLTLHFIGGNFDNFCLLLSTLICRPKGREEERREGEKRREEERRGEKRREEERERLADKSK